jgi:hypothetical protein
VKVCVGIRDSKTACRQDWIADFSRDGGIVCRPGEELLLTVSDYASAPGPPTMVTMTVERVPSGAIVWNGVINSLFLSERPSLVWIDRE